MGRRGKTVAGIQPGYLPWLGYFDQMLNVDVFLIADQMPYSSSGWAHRNRVRGPHGSHWLTLPARPTRDQRIADVALDESSPWKHKHLTTLRHFYSTSPHARPLIEELGAALQGDATRLGDATIPAIECMARMLGVTTPILVSSRERLEERYLERFPEQPSATHRIVSYLQALGADELLEGASGRDYLDTALCREHAISVRFHDYEHPRYRQLFEPFVSHLSAVDLLLTAGVDEARRVLREGAART